MYDVMTAPVIDLLSRYDRPGPRYTSYPTAVEFHEGVNEATYRERLARANADLDQPLSLYVHLPFCEARCSYCGCNVVITSHRHVEQRYLDYLEREIDLVAALLPDRRLVSQMHWGGGTPTYHSPEDLRRIFAAVSRHFTFTPDAEIGIEIDPRVTSVEQLACLRELGFNRLSLGVQDFAPEVQQAVNRIQSYELTRDIIAAGRRLGFASATANARSTCLRKTWRTVFCSLTAPDETSPPARTARSRRMALARRMWSRASAKRLCFQYTWARLLRLAETLG